MDSDCIALILSMTTLVEGDIVISKFINKAPLVTQTQFMLNNPDKLRECMFPRSVVFNYLLSYDSLIAMINNDIASKLLSNFTLGDWMELRSKVLIEKMFSIESLKGKDLIPSMKLLDGGSMEELFSRCENSDSLFLLERMLDEIGLKQVSDDKSVIFSAIVLINKCIDLNLRELFFFILYEMNISKLVDMKIPDDFLGEKSLDKYETLDLSPLSLIQLMKEKVICSYLLCRSKDESKIEILDRINFEINIRLEVLMKK